MSSKPPAGDAAPRRERTRKRLGTQRITTVRPWQLVARPGYQAPIPAPIPAQTPVHAPGQPIATPGGMSTFSTPAMSTPGTLAPYTVGTMATTPGSRLAPRSAGSFLEQPSPYMDIAVESPVVYMESEGISEADIERVAPVLKQEQVVRSIANLTPRMPDRVPGDVTAAISRKRSRPKNAEEDIPDEGGEPSYRMAKKPHHHLNEIDVIASAIAEVLNTYSDAHDAIGQNAARLFANEVNIDLREYNNLLRELGILRSARARVNGKIQKLRFDMLEISGRRESVRRDTAAITASTKAKVKEREETRQLTEFLDGLEALRSTRTGVVSAGVHAMMASVSDSSHVLNHASETMSGLITAISQLKEST